MTKYKIILLLILIPFVGFTQDNHSKKSIDELVKEIAMENELTSRAVGFGGSPSGQYQRYDVLKSKATREQLIKLTEHESPVIRCYAFWGLADRQEKDLFPILIDHLGDTATINRQFGCVLSKVSVADFYIELLTKRYLITEDYYRKNHSQALLEEKNKLDSLILYTPNNLEYLDRLLWEHEPIDRDYARIKELGSVIECMLPK